MQLMKNNPDWWKNAVVYQIYPRSFMDSNGDGIGDLPGITSKLEYIADLGVDAIWISPFFTSPMTDFGYDVADYCDVDPMFGTLDDFKLLIARAHELGVCVLIDLVLSHSSDQHPWFKESRQSRDNPKADWYVWADPKPDGGPPNNWLPFFGGTSWEWDSTRGQYYLHNFLTTQPDLNFHNPDVRAALLDVARFWFDLGVDGSRMDVANFYYHNASLEDNPPVPEDAEVRNGGAVFNPRDYQLHINDISRPETISFMQEFRTVLDQYPGTTSIGEVNSEDMIRDMRAYTSGNDKLHSVYTFELLVDQSEPSFIRDVIRDTENRIGDGHCNWALSNHDIMRIASRWGQGKNQQAFAKVALALMLSLRGCVTIYQGEELGLPESEVPHDLMQDPYGIAFWPKFKGRDGCRTPIPWNQHLHAGFSEVEPWLPVDAVQQTMSVESQQSIASSTLNFTKQFLRWRKQQSAIMQGDFSVLENTGELLCFTRCSEQQSLFMAFNTTKHKLTASLDMLVTPIQGHGFNGHMDGTEITLEPCDALFAIIN